MDPRTLMRIGMFCMIIPTAYAQTTGINDAFRNSYTLETQGKYQEALDAIRPVYTEDAYPANLRMAWLEYSAGQHENSVMHYRKAIRLKPGATEPWWGITYPLSALKQWNELEKAYLAILKTDPMNATANYQLALIYYYRQDYVNASRYIEPALTLYPFQYDYLMLGAWTRLYLGQKEKARDGFQTLLLNRPDDESAKEGLKQLK